MATNEGGTTRKTSTGGKSTTSRSTANDTTIDKARDAATDFAGEFVKAVKARPYAAAALAASAAGVGALVWAKRAVIGEQASAAGEKIAEQAGALRDTVSEQTGALRDKVSERFSSAEEPSAIGGTAADIQVDPLIDDQSKVGAIAY